jgi:hypothetical protein
LAFFAHFRPDFPNGDGDMSVFLTLSTASTARFSRSNASGPSIISGSRFTSGSSHIYKSSSAGDGIGSGDVAASNTGIYESGHTAVLPRDIRRAWSENRNRDSSTESCRAGPSGWFSTGPNFTNRSCAMVGSGVRSTTRSPRSTPSRSASVRPGSGRRVWRGVLAQWSGSRSRRVVSDNFFAGRARHIRAVICSSTFTHPVIRIERSRQAASRLKR